jgi:predicted flap endonuclease-1-like 5' DNA nuclease
MPDRGALPAKQRRQVETAASPEAVRRAFPPGIGAPALRALAAVGLTSLQQLVTLRERELLAMHGLGPKAVRILRDAMHLRGLAFKS